ncbi:hypothetical protein [Rhodopirellula halodulae]|uniref:hypothetical protein n=1 Tax=Rhodopirellula halodulae TaxID=2894198 RepID=UPI001E38345A|nr:hypothetical protein [Rhodopirellula sp. JC737]MCC9654344.1 hypothetical protein [Rhodopirellula sp. JC737]
MLESLRQSILAAQNAWSGCCWDTQFGTCEVNLNGLTSQQASLAAKALRGEEAACWNLAAVWLEQVETDARKASDFAEQAFSRASVGDRETAIALLEHAIKLAARYPVVTGYKDCMLQLPAATEHADH